MKIEGLRLDPYATPSERLAAMADFVVSQETLAWSAGYAAGFDAGEQEAYAEAAEWRELALGLRVRLAVWRILAIATLLALLIVAVWA